MKILTLNMLRELIASGKTNKIKMKTRYIAHHDHCRTSTDKTNIEGNFKITEYTDPQPFWILEWSTDEGDPNISLHSEEQEINFISDSSDSDFEYLLYIDI